jgi:cholesterol oxidase
MRGRHDQVSEHPDALEPEGHFDAIVVGSGFGGAVMTYRLSEAGMSVCLLERGRAYPPGSFPRSPWEMGRNFWDPSEGLHGLFDVWSFRGLGGIVASGLGGGSLLWSNVVLRKDRSTFVQEEGEYWPIGYDDLVPHYERHEAMLRRRLTPSTALRTTGRTRRRRWSSRPRRSGSSGSCRRSR